MPGPPADPARLAAGEYLTKYLSETAYRLHYRLTRLLHARARAWCHAEARVALVSVAEHPQLAAASGLERPLRIHRRFCSIALRPSSGAVQHTSTATSPTASGSERLLTTADLPQRSRRREFASRGAGKLTDNHSRRQQAGRGVGLGGPQACWCHRDLAPCAKIRLWSATVGRRSGLVFSVALMMYVPSMTGETVTLTPQWTRFSRF